MRVYGVWHGAAKGIRVDHCVPDDPDLRKPPDLRTSPTPQRRAELWRTWSESNPPTIVELGLDVLDINVTDDAVEVTCFDHSQARTVLAPHYGDVLVLRDPPFALSS